MNLFFKFILISVFIFDLQSAYSKSTVLLTGGFNGEINSKNIFEEDFKILESAFTEIQWDTTVLFSNNGKDLSQRPTPQNIKSNLKKAIDAAASGDQISLVLLGHGEAGRENQRTHDFITESSIESRNLFSGEKFDLDELQEELERAVAKGLRISVVDLSCYSGKSQALSTSNSCILTLSAPNYTTFCAGDANSGIFTQTLAQALKEGKGKSLQDVFLQARKQDTSSINFPQISSIETPYAKLWDEFLEIHDPAGVKYGNLAVAGDALCFVCQSSSQFEKMIADLENLKESGLVLQARSLQADYVKNLEEMRIATNEINAILKNMKEATPKTLNPETVSNFSKWIVKWSPQKNRYDKAKKNIKKISEKIMNFERNVYDTFKKPKENNICQKIII